MDNKNYFISAFGTFGNPNGFRQSFFFLDDSLNKIARNLTTFDLNTVAIKILPNSKVYSIRKEFIDNNNIYSYTIYSFAKEQNSERGGTFIVSSIIYKGKIGNENITLNVLEDFHQNLIKKNVEKETISVNHSDKFTVSKPKDFDKININLKDVAENLNLIKTNKSLVVFCETSSEKLQTYFKKSVDLLNIYDTIYFTQSEEIVTFVAQKGIFKFIQQVGDKKELDQEIEKLQAERKQKITNAISSLKNQKEKLKEEEKRELENQKIKIDKKEKAHSENGENIQEDKQNLTKLEKLYDTFSYNISSLISSLHSGKNLDEINNSYKQLEKEFNEEKRKLGSTTQLSSVFTPRITPHPNPPKKPPSENNEDGEKRSNSKVLTIISLVLNVLLIGGITYLYFINDQNEKKIADTENIPASNEGSDFNESDSVLVESKLNPLPNDVAKNRIDDIKNKLTDNSTKIDEVVKIIFEINKPVRDAYKYQKADYEEFLIQENPSAFDVNKILIKKDSLIKIPFYKDENLKNESVSNTTSTK